MDDTKRGDMKTLYNNFILLVSFLPYTLSNKQIIHQYGMDDRKVCYKESNRLFWIDDNERVLVIGKNTPPQSSTAAPACKLIFGSRSGEGKNALHVKFESFYINDCAIVLGLYQSPSSVFDVEVEEIITLSCEMPTPAPFHTQTNRFLMLTLTRDDQYMRDYNFRINITLSEGAPKTGPSTAVVIIIGVALVSAIAVLSFILVKYIRLKRVIWRERRAERAIEQAIHVYNSQELHRDIPYTTVPSHQSCSCPTHERLQYGSNQSSNGHYGNLLTVNGSNRRSSDIYDFNRSDQDVRQSLSEHEENVINNETNREFDTESLPPSYEEALEMPKPILPESPIYANT